MSTITSSGLSLTKPLTEEQLKKNTEIDAEQQLDQEDFFSLLSQQLAYQDPFSPVENAEMISQMSSLPQRKVLPH
jgi:flagellar basal-body rod modification protein FlgD